MNKIFKIYKIQFPNGKVYIGQTYNTHKRWLEHLYEASSGNQLKVYKAMRKYNIVLDNFSIIEDNILTQEEANTKEIYYIEQYNAIKNGYNIGTGGASGWQPRGETHPKAVLTDEELLVLRKVRHLKQYSMNEIYELYKDRVSYSGFEKYWNYESRPEVGKEFDSEDLHTFYKLNKNQLRGQNHFLSKLSDDQVLEARTKYWVEGIKMKDVWKNYKDLYSLSGFRKIILGRTFTNVPMPQKTSLCKKKKDWFNKEQVLLIKRLSKEGNTPSAIRKEYFPEAGLNSILNIIKGKTYKTY